MIIRNILIGLVLIVVLEVAYLTKYKTMTNDIKTQKITFVKLVGLPDLALGTNDIYIRHRSLANIFDIYPNDSQLREYGKLSFSYNHSTLLQNTPSRIINEK
jgi:hypothetical protein